MAGGRTIRANVVESLPPGKTEWDSEVRGFGVRRQRRDAFYIVKYRDRDGRQRVFTIGRHGPGDWMPDRAERKPSALRGLSVMGAILLSSAIGQRAHRPWRPSWIATSASTAAHKKTSTRIQDERRLTLNILPALGSTKLRDIDRAHVARLHASLIETPVTANRVVDLLSADSRMGGACRRAAAAFQPVPPYRPLSRKGQGTVF